jgi:hypothetical protein
VWFGLVLVPFIWPSAQIQICQQKTLSWGGLLQNLLGVARGCWLPAAYAAPAWQCCAFIECQVAFALYHCQVKVIKSLAFALHHCKVEIIKSLAFALHDCKVKVNECREVFCTNWLNAIYLAISSDTCQE